MCACEICARDWERASSGAGSSGGGIKTAQSFLNKNNLGRGPYDQRF